MKEESYCLSCDKIVDVSRRTCVHCKTETVRFFGYTERVAPYIATILLLYIGGIIGLVLIFDFLIMFIGISIFSILFVIGIYAWWIPHSKAYDKDLEKGRKLFDERNEDLKEDI
ncbi:MAG: hypothetical protein ACFFFG_18230 [Candidatus Thorarchaeota archaeon]